MTKEVRLFLKDSNDRVVEEVMREQDLKKSDAVEYIIEEWIVQNHSEKKRKAK